MQDHVIKGSCDFIDRESLIVRHDLTKFGGHRHHGSGGIMVLAAEEQNPTCLLNSVITTYLSSTFHAIQLHKMS